MAKFSSSPANQLESDSRAMLRKNNKKIRYAVGSALSFFLSIAIVHASPVATDINLEKKLRKAPDLSPALDDVKYMRIAVLAGDQLPELEKRKNEVIRTYKKWTALKSSADAASSPAKLKETDDAALAYSQANLSFVSLQKEILVKSGIVTDDVVLSDLVNALNAVAPSAAGPKAARPPNHTPNKTRIETPGIPR